MLGHRDRAVLDAGELREPPRAVIDTVVHIACERGDLRRQRVVGDRHVGDAPADVGILAVGETRLLRVPLLRRRDGEFQCSAGDACVDGREQDLEDREDAEHDGVGAGARVDTAHHVRGIGDGAVQPRGATLRAARMPRVSQSSEVVTASVRPMKANTSWGASGLVVSSPCRPSRVHNRGEEVKILVPVKEYPPSPSGTAAVSLPNSTRVVAALADAEREDLARDRAILHELQSWYAAVGEDLGDARPHEVHVDGQGGRRCGTRETLLQDRGFGESESGAPAHGRHQDRQVSRGPQLVEVLRGEGVLAVMDRCALADALEKVVGEELRGIERAHASASRS